MMRNIKTREGFEFWDKICALPHYGFLLASEGNRVVKAEGVGDWIERHEAQQIVDQAQERISELRAELDTMTASAQAIRDEWRIDQQRLTTADQRIDDLEAQLADREQSRRSWFDQCQELEKDALSANAEPTEPEGNPEGKRESFEKWVMATKHPVFGFLDGRSLARSDDRTGYADEYIQGLWVAYLAFGGFASRDDSIGWLKRIDGIGQNRAELIYSMGFRRLAD